MAEERVVVEYVNSEYGIYSTDEAGFMQMMGKYFGSTIPQLCDEIDRIKREDFGMGFAVPARGEITTLFGALCTLAELHGLGL